MAVLNINIQRDMVVLMSKSSIMKQNYVVEWMHVKDIIQRQL